MFLALVNYEILKLAIACLKTRDPVYRAILWHFPATMEISK